MVMYGDDVCCSVVFGTLVGVFVFSVMWSELLMTSAISCPLWSSVYECQRVECAFTSPVRTGCDMLVMYCIPCCMSVSVMFCGSHLVRFHITYYGLDSLREYGPYTSDFSFWMWFMDEALTASSVRLFHGVITRRV